MWTLGGVTLLLGCTATPSTVNRESTHGLDEFLEVPAGNAVTPAKVALGERLFFDPLLSRDSTIACASCHRPNHAFSDTGSVSVGVGGRRGRRNVPTVFNRAYGRSHFWDGRSTTLEDQALRPIEDSLEMDNPAPEMVRRLRGSSSYRAAFRTAFPDGVTADNVARALASYLRTLRTTEAPIDRFRNGDRNALSESAQRGFALFLGKGNCASCHFGPNFTDEEFHNTGVAWRDGTPGDSGRFAVTRADRDLGAFKTPTLREVACSAPYMHDGSLRTLGDVIAFYDHGGHVNPQLDAEIRPLRLDREEQRSLIEFLQALGGNCQRDHQR
jgi:cytochrome c peroxidase